MPWRQEPMKDAEGGETRRWGANNRWSGDFRMGKPIPMQVGILRVAHGNSNF